MRAVYKVSPWRDGWQVRRGHTGALYLDTFDQAARTAEALARAAAAAGDTGVVSIQGPDQPVLSVFRPDMPPRPASTPFDPERDEAERAERLAHARI